MGGAGPDEADFIDLIMNEAGLPDYAGEKINSFFFSPSRALHGRDICK